MLISGKLRIALGEGRSQQGGEPNEHFSHHYHHYLSPPGCTGNRCMTEEMISEELKDNMNCNSQDTKLKQQVTQLFDLSRGRFF